MGAKDNTLFSAEMDASCFTPQWSPHSGLCRSSRKYGTPIQLFHGCTSRTLCPKNTIVQLSHKHTPQCSQQELIPLTWATHYICVCHRCNVTKRVYASKHVTDSSGTDAHRRRTHWQQKGECVLMGQPRIRVMCAMKKKKMEIWERPGKKWIHECMHVCWQRGCVHCCLAFIPSITALNPVSPIPTPLRKLVHHAGSEEPWRGRICTAALLCLMLHITSRGIDIPQPFLSPSLPPQQWSSPCRCLLTIPRV